MPSSRAWWVVSSLLALAACGRQEGPLEVEGVGQVKVGVRPAPVMPTPPTQPPQPGTNHLPVVTLADLPTPTVLLGEQFSLGYSASDPDGDALLIEWRTSLVNLVSSDAQTATFSTSTAGAGWVTVRVSDQRGGVAVATVYFGVAAPPVNPNPPPNRDAGVPPVSPACPAVAPWANPDAVGDVSLANADIIGSAATIANGQVDLRMQFCQRPFPLTATHMLDWCLDTDASGATNFCGYGSGTDNGVALSNLSTVVVVGSTHQFNLCDVATWDEASRTLRVVLPASAFGSPTTFRYKLGSIFGGSFGANDWSPVDQLSASMHPLSASLPPFFGVGWCSVNPEHLGP